MLGTRNIIADKDTLGSLSTWNLHCTSVWALEKIHIKYLEQSLEYMLEKNDYNFQLGGVIVISQSIWTSAKIVKTDRLYTCVLYTAPIHQMYT